MTVDVHKLRELAQKATPGPWEPCPHRMYVFSARGEMIADGIDDCGGIEIRGAGARLPMDENCEYIAALSPDVLIALLDDLDAVRAEAKRARIEGMADVDRFLAFEYGMNERADARKYIARSIEALERGAP